MIPADIVLLIADLFPDPQDIVSLGLVNKRFSSLLLTELQNPTSKFAQSILKKFVHEKMEINVFEDNFIMTACVIISQCLPSGRFHGTKRSWIPGLDDVGEFLRQFPNAYQSGDHKSISDPTEKEKFKNLIFKSGRLQRESVYFNGNHHGNEVSYYSNLIIECKRSWICGRKDGSEEKWHSGGNRSYKTTWKEGHQNGLEESWFPSGTKHFRRTWEGGKLNGLEEWWGASGQKMKTQWWKDGQQTRPPNALTLFSSP